jgi:hypothetical protein
MLHLSRLEHLSLQWVLSIQLRLSRLMDQRHLSLQ